MLPGTNVDTLNALLRHQCDFLYGIEKTRIATSNRLHALVETKKHDKNLERLLLEANLAQIQALEDAAIKSLKATFSRHPLSGWTELHPGIGPQQTARLLSEIGDPLWRYDYDADEWVRRSLAELRQYCGHGDAKRNRRSKENVAYVLMDDEERPQLPYSPRAKMRLRLIAKQVLKTPGGKCGPCKRDSGDGWQPPPRDCECAALNPLRAVYNDARLNWIGKDVTPGHADSHGLRVMGKQILRSLYQYSLQQEGEAA
jgi:hypothetical protein